MSMVLVVEDNVDLANVIRSFLEFENHSVDVFHTGNEGLGRILTQPYDLVILDWDLPGVDGLEILRQFRNSGSETPVIMLTGKNTIDDMETGLDRGADDYLTKPFNMKELGARVKVQLRRSSGTTDSINLGDIFIDLVNSRVSRADHTYSLPAPEFRLLEIAAKYPHISATAAYLLQAAWSQGEVASSDEGDQKLRMALRRLRKKFDPQGKIIFPHLYPEVKSQSEFKSDSEFPVVLDLLDNLSEGDHLMGTIFNGKYELLEIIGGGGSGLVFRAKHLHLDTEVALKLVHAKTLSSAEVLARFQREARITGNLAHQNIVAVRDYGISEQKQPYLVMELVNGASLAEYLRQYGRPPVREVVDIFIQACAGLHHAHQKNIVHRDLKPSNLMLIHEIGGDTETDTNGGVAVKLVDFGLARPLTVSPSEQITQVGEVLGSPAYMSPEQCRGEVVDFGTDIYGLGCTLFEALSGAPPFVGKDTVDVLVKHITVPAPEMVLGYIDLGLQSRLNHIVARCLAKDKSKRYQSAFQLRDELLQVMNDKLPENKSAQQSDLAGPPAAQWRGRRQDLLSWFNKRFTQ